MRFTVYDNGLKVGIGSCDPYFIFQIVIRSGYGRDPPDIPGLAHLVEHEMGTPIQQRLVPQHGSEVHAKTWAQATVITIKAPLPPGEDKIKQTRSIVRATMKCALFFCFDGEPSPDDVREIIQDIDGEFQYRRQKPSIAELANAIRDRQAGFHGPRDGNAKTFLGQAGQRFTTLIHEVTAVRQALYQPSNAFILAFMPEPAQSTFQTCISAWLQAKRNRPCRPLSDRYYAKLLCSSVRDAPSLAQGANIVLITTRETQTFQLRLCTAATERNVHCRCCNTAFCHNFSRQINRLKDRDLRITDTEDLAGNGIHGITIEMRFEADRIFSDITNILGILKSWQDAPVQVQHGTKQPPANRTGMESMIELHRSAVSTTGLSDSQHHTMCQGYAGTAIAADLAQLRNATLFLSLHKAEPFSQILRKELESLRTCEGLVYETFSFAIYPNSLPTLLKSAIDVMRSVCERRTVPVHFEQRARATSANFSFGTTSITYRPAVAIRELEGALLLAIPLTSLPRADLLHQLISALSPNALRCGSSVAEERPYALQLKILPTEGVTARYEALRLLDTSIDTCQAMRPDAYANFRRRCIASVLQRRKTADGIQSRVDWNKYFYNLEQLLDLLYQVRQAVEEQSRETGQASKTAEVCQVCQANPDATPHQRLPLSPISLNKGR